MHTRMAVLRRLAVAVVAVAMAAITAAPASAGVDTVPPSKPPAPTFSSVTTTAANVSWGEATDNVQVTGYHLQQLVSGSWTTVRTVGAAERFQAVSGLAPGTAHTFAVIAFDAAGNQSARSDPGTFSTLAITTTPTCRVQIITFSPGLMATITLINTTTAPVSGWTAQFTLPTTMTVTSAFNGTVTRSGATATFTPAIWINTVNPGVQTTVGFSASGTPFTPPSAFTLNGTPCTN
ncbi:cellulose binding domain-containing protein [Acrocarpospora catenulata]|uniref:cellulose binding domain-containing protein n=1 Tax=Acrocarpospora catenulata TaxID=2836182 RepID=UPI001BD9BF70|nr:cellulose binding domain-containing protein [Acrocarpospora catenulata]